MTAPATAAGRDTPVWLRFAILGALALLPPAAEAVGQPYLVDVFARVMIFAIAAVSLDLLLGFGGLVSFGHAAFVGVGAYAAGILNHHGIESGFVQFPAALAAAALFSLAIGAVCVRTSGVYFIMITLAFAQMLFYLGVSLEPYGGDDGMPYYASTLVEPIDLYDVHQLYYLTFAALAGVLLLLGRLVNARFGMAVRGTRSNERRMRAVGFPTYRYKLACFVVSGTLCGLAGILFAHQSGFVSPNVMHWTRSGELIVMVILGGMGTLYGAVVGAAAYLLLEGYLPELLEAVSPGWGEHWQLVFGPLLILVVLYARRGLLGLAAGFGGRRDG